jgi:hypothetical protein
LKTKEKEVKWRMGVIRDTAFTVENKTFRLEITQALHVRSTGKDKLEKMQLRNEGGKEISLKMPSLYLMSTNWLVGVFTVFNRYFKFDIVRVALGKNSDAEKGKAAHVACILLREIWTTQLLHEGRRKPQTLIEFAGRRASPMQTDFQTGVWNSAQELKGNSSLCC